MSDGYMAEMAVVGCLLLHGNLLDDVIGRLRPDDFADYNCKTVYEAILELKSEGIDKIDMLVVAEKKWKKFANNENVAFGIVAEMANGVASTANLSSYVGIVKQHSKRRQTVSIMNEVMVKIKNLDTDYLEHLSRRIGEIDADVVESIKAYSTVIDETLQQLEHDSKNPNDVVGLPTGFADIDHIINGLMPKSLIILAARPSQGKTMLMLNIIDNISVRKKNPIAVFSLEQSANDLFKRSLARFARISGDRIFKAKFHMDDWKKINDSLAVFQDSKIFINDSGSTSIYEIRNFCRMVKKQHGLKAVFVDYIGMVQGGNAENETLRLAYISRELKVLAKDFDVPVFVLCQLNRKIEGEKREPRLSDLRQSGNIEQDADVVMFLESDFDTQQAVLFVKKNRNGATGEVRLSLFKELLEFRNHAR